MSSVLRYPFPVAEWTRVIWASSAARGLWEPRLQRIGQAWEAAERASVGAFRDACLQNVSTDDLPQLAQKATDTRLELVVLAKQAVGGSYTAQAASPAQGEPYCYRVAITARQAARPFLEAFRKQDDETIGQLLGFPPCCRAFYRRIWVDEQWRDTTWPMAQAQDGTVAVVDGPVEANILGRWFGVRWVPHLPCSFQCEQSAAFGRQFRALMPKQEAGWMDDLLDGPMQWSAWHGIAEIVTPVLKVSSKTDATADKLVVQRDGPRYAEAGASGVAFPYRRKTCAEPAAVIQIGVLRQADPREWTDNGFSSREAMQDAHAMVMKALADNVGWRADGKVKVADLGCGNGLLLKAIRERFPNWLVEGVEEDAERASRAKVPIAVGRIQDAESIMTADYDIALMSVRRWEEFTPDETAAVKQWLMWHAKLVLEYSYDAPMFARWRD